MAYIILYNQDNCIRISVTAAAVPGQVPAAALTTRSTTKSVMAMGSGMREEKNSRSMRPPSSCLATSSPPPDPDWAEYWP